MTGQDCAAVGGRRFNTYPMNMRIDTRLVGFRTSIAHRTYEMPEDACHNLKIGLKCERLSQIPFMLTDLVSLVELDESKESVQIAYAYHTGQKYVKR